MKSFDQVSRRTQRTWLKELATIALERYGIRSAELRFISESSAIVFKVLTGSDEYVLRVNPESVSDAWITRTTGELLWLMALRRDTDLVVPKPVLAEDGSFVQKVNTRKIPEGRLVDLLHWMPGKPIGKQPSLKLSGQMGVFMAQLHAHTETFSLPIENNRPHTSWEKLTYWQDPQNDTSALLTANQRQLCADASRRLFIEIEEIGTEEDYGLVHADMTLNNCLLEQGQLGVIDFADSRYSSHYYDLAVPLVDFTEYWQIENRKYEQLRERFYQGYSGVRPLGSRYESAVETFMVARAFDVVEWIHLDWPSVTYFSFGPELLSQSLQQIQAYMQ